MGINYLFLNNSTTALITAVLEGKTKLVTKLLETEGIDVNAKDSNGDTALHCAVWQRNVPLLEMLLKVDGIEVNAQNEKGATILHYAVLKEDIELLRRLLQVKDIKDLLNHNDESALSLAVEKKNIAAVKELLKIPQYLGASSGDDPILHPAVKDGSTEIVKPLLDAKADGESGGDSALDLALDCHLKTLNALIEAHINPNLQNIELETALHRSVSSDTLDEKKDTVSQESIEMTKALLKAGIDPMLTDQDNCTALDYAHEAGNYGVIELLNPYFKTTKQNFSFFGSKAPPKKDDESELLEGDVVFRNTQTG
jgi:ankyrin repeat protein